MTIQPVGNLVDAVAARAGVDNASVLEVLAAHGIPTATVPTARRSLRVIRLRLRGTKTGVPDAGPFDRTFTLPAGVVIAVGPNLRGKTSLLEIITLCLRGTPRELQLDVASWLDAVECDADVNGVPLRFRLAMSGGQITEAAIAELPSDGAPGAAEPVPGRTLVTASTAAEYRAGSITDLQRDALAELITVGRLLRNLNQAVARLNATSQPGADLGPAAGYCMQVARRADEAIVMIRRSLR